MLKYEQSSHNVNEVDDVEKEFVHRSSQIHDIITSLESEATKAEQQLERLLSDATETIRDEIERRSEQVINSAIKWRAEMRSRADAIMNSASIDIHNEFSSVKKNIRNTDKERDHCTIYIICIG